MLQTSLFEVISYYKSFEGFNNSKESRWRYYDSKAQEGSEITFYRPMSLLLIMFKLFEKSVPQKTESVIKARKFNSITLVWI